MSIYTKTNITEVEDLAPKFGMDEIGEARFAREALGADRIGMTYYRVKPGQRLSFGHRHSAAEEVYLVLSGSGRFRVEDDVFEIGERDVVFVTPQAMRGWETDAGLELVAFGEHPEDDQGEMDQEWWTD